MILTLEQRAAAEATGRRIFLQASAGSGKTRTLAARIAHLVRAGVDPETILALTFTRSAAEEVRARVAQELGPYRASLVAITTFHAWAAGRVVPEGHRVASESETEWALRSLYEGAQRRRRRDVPGIEAVRAAIMAHEAGLPVEPDARHALEVMLWAKLQPAKLVPTWNLLPLALELDRADAGPALAHVLCDEAQDVSPNEERLVEDLVARWGGSLFAVGDERQAIMQFRGARGMRALRAPDPLIDPRPEDQVLELTRTFRFGARVAGVANAIAARFGGAPLEGAPDVEDRADRVEAGDLVKLVEERPGETLVLARTNFECAQLARELGQGLAEHVRRLPGDRLEHAADRFGAVWASGRAVIATCHSSKGREADLVVLAMDLERDRGADEERVRYVAATRARRRLVLLERPDEDRLRGYARSERYEPVAVDDRELACV